MGDLARINTNVAAMRAFQTLTDINTRIVKAQEHISTGKVVNRASDSPSDYYISRTLERSINSVKRQNDNIERGINFLQTNDSRLGQVANILIEMSDLANQANSIAVTSAEKQAIQQDLEQLRMEVEAILHSGVSSRLYTGFTLGGLHGVSLTGNLTSNPLSALTINGTHINVTGSQTVLDNTISNIDKALDIVLRDEERLGSFIKRLEVEFDVNEVEIVNLKASLSSIADADLAEEQMELTKLNILQQAALAMLAQSNSAPQSIMMLFN
ncbi:MAG: flagellin [Candidatus Auribacterota bacterium]|jgi:flagellin|nr:flagellin [Candidatus Auribacterota bacterium]